MNPPLMHPIKIKHLSSPTPRALSDSPANMGIKHYLIYVYWKYLPPKVHTGEIYKQIGQKSKMALVEKSILKSCCQSGLKSIADRPKDLDTS